MGDDKVFYIYGKMGCVGKRCSIEDLAKNSNKNGVFLAM